MVGARVPAATVGTTSEYELVVSDVDSLDPRTDVE